jgi:acyl carrier protein
VPNPFSTTGGERLYRTGDVARHTTSGRIEFLGRRDNQVKVRGYRIELGEVESVLCEHQGVKAAAVTVSKTESAHKWLVAFVVQAQGYRLSVDELQNYLKRRLPEYMAPSRIVIMDSLPLTLSGKIDRRRLPALDDLRIDLGATFTPPCTPAEKLIAGVWAKTLGVDIVSIHDNFFALGGHSLLATQVIFHLREIFHLDLTLRSLFEAPTVRALFEKIAFHLGGEEIMHEIARTYTEVERLSDESIQIMILEQHAEAVS